MLPPRIKVKTISELFVIYQKEVQKFKLTGKGKEAKVHIRKYR